METSEASPGKDPIHISTALQETMIRLAAERTDRTRPAVLPTGIAALDELTDGGLRPGQLVVIGSRASAGKSALALSFARNTTMKHQVSTLFATPEMSHAAVVQRLLAAEAGVPVVQLRNRCVSDEGWARLTPVLEKLKTTPLFVDGSPFPTVAQIRAIACRLNFDPGLALIVIDRLELLDSPDSESRHLEIADISRALKLLAMELNVTIVATTQLEHPQEPATEKRPTMADLYESNASERQADIVILLHREQGHPDDPQITEAELIVAKNPNGKTGTIPVVFQGEYARFMDPTTS
jgi:replicative DNA helicase